MKLHFILPITKNELSFSIFMLYSLADKWKMSPAKVYKIKVNRIRCRKCGDVITSESVHDFKFCKCHSCAVDGGTAYLRRCGYFEDWEDLSEVEEIQEE